MNPFTPQAMREASKRKLQSFHDQSYSPSWALSQSECSSQDVSSLNTSDDSEQDTSPLPAKRLHVSEMSVTRYQEEFLELAKVASGQFRAV